MNFEFDENQMTVKEIASGFAKKYIAPIAEELSKERKISDELNKKFAEADLLGIAFDEKYGGLGMGYSCQVIFEEEIAKVSGGISFGINVSQLFMEAINTFGSESQKERYLPAIIAGDIRGSFAFTEPSTGSDPKQLETTYRVENGYYRINGVKRFISNASYPGPILIFAKHAETGKITAFVFDKFIEGYSLSSSWDTICVRESPTYDVFLDDVKLPVDGDHVVAGEGNGFPVLLGATSYSKVGVLGVFLGIMEAAYEQAEKYAKEKLHRGVPIGQKFQAIQVRLAEIAALVESCRWMIYHTAVEADKPDKDMDKFRGQIGMVKAYVTDTCVEACMKSMNILGAYGVTEEYKVERFLRDALIGPHVEGVSDMQKVMYGGYVMRH